MAGSKKGGATIELQQASYNNMMSQMNLLQQKSPAQAMKMLITLLFDIKTLAQLKLKSDRHIDTSRLRNSIYVKTLAQKGAKRADNKESYTVKGKTYSKELDVELTNKEGAVGTNVEYAAAIEFGYPAQTITPKNGKFLSWLPKAEGEAWFDFGKSWKLKKYYKDKTGSITLEKQNRVFAKKVNHPGFAGDSFLYWALKHVNVEKRAMEMYQDLFKEVKVGYTGKKNPTVLTNAVD